MEITKMATIKIIKLSTIPNEFSSHIGMGPKKFQKGIRNPFVSAKRNQKSPFACLCQDINATSSEAEPNQAPEENILKPCGGKKRYGSQRKSAYYEHNAIATDKQKNYPCLSLLQLTGIFIKMGLLWIPFHPFSPLTSRLTLPNSSFSRMSYISTCLCPGGLKAKYSLTRVIP